MKLPKQIFVTAEEGDDSDSGWLAASKTMEDAFDGTQSAEMPVVVGVYKLERVEAVSRKLKSVTVKEK